VNRFLPLVLLSAVLVLAGPADAATEPRGEWPLQPRPEVVRTFDPPDVVWGSGHRGVDLRGSTGQSVRAALPGRVSFTGRIAGVGIVVVDHGATRTTYQPVDAAVRVGTEVAAGAVLGTLEWYGSHCLPAACLHWGLVRGETYLDPLALVGGPSPVRLLPLDATPAASPVRPRPVLVQPTLPPGGAPAPGLALHP
jgi:murein DD-endopeptidase MepM/ murein hydrolase activator NlpD